MEQSKTEPALGLNSGPRKLRVRGITPEHKRRLSIDESEIDGSEIAEVVTVAIVKG
jgi:hypothetical protein